MSELSDAQAIERLHPMVQYICKQLNRVVEQESELSLLRGKIQRAVDALESWVKCKCDTATYGASVCGRCMLLADLRMEKKT